MKKFTDAELRPLAGVSVVVTRANHQAAYLSSKLQELGANVTEVPTIEISAPQSWQDVDNAIELINRYDWILFASANAVEFFIRRWNESAHALRFAGKIAAIGPRTAEALRRKQLQPSFQPVSASISEALIEEFPGYPNLLGVKILWPRTNIGRDLILAKFCDAGAQVDVVNCYQTALPSTNTPAILKFRDALKKGEIDIITVASSQSVRNLAKILQESYRLPYSENLEGLRENIRSTLNKTAIITIGPETTATAVECLGKCEGQAQDFNMDGLVAAVLNYVSTNADTRS